MKFYEIKKLADLKKLISFIHPRSISLPAFVFRIV